MPELLDSGHKSWTLDSGCWTLDAGLWTLHAGLWMLDPRPWTLDAGLWSLDAGLWTLHYGLWVLNARLRTCTLLTAKPWSASGASHQPAFMGNCLNISHPRLPCPPGRWVSPCVLCLIMIGRIVALLTFMWVVSMVLVTWKLVLF